MKRLGLLVLLFAVFIIILWNKADEDAYVSVNTDVIVPKGTSITSGYAQEAPGFEIFTLIIALGIVLIISKRR